MISQLLVYYSALNVDDGDQNGDAISRVEKGGLRERTGISSYREYMEAIAVWDVGFYDNTKRKCTG